MPRSVARFFRKNEGTVRGGGGGAGVADQDSRYRLSIDPYTKCHFYLRGLKGGLVYTWLAYDAQAPPAPPGYTPALIMPDFFLIILMDYICYLL